MKANVLRLAMGALKQRPIAGAGPPFQGEERVFGFVLAL
jgi:hypothetical protein